jgi:hypothetical protein
MGDLLGHGVRFGVASDVLAAGEGIETMLSLRMVLPSMPMMAALSANHLAAILFPPGLRRLYVARDADSAGDRAAETLISRARKIGIDAITLSPKLSDFNDDLRHLGIDQLRGTVRSQLAAIDAARLVSERGPKRNTRFSVEAAHSERRETALAGGPRHGLREGDRPAGGPGPATADLRFLPLPGPPHHAGVAGTPGSPAFLASQESLGPPSSAALRPLSLRPAVQARPARRLVIAIKAAMGAADPQGHHHGDRPQRTGLRTTTHRLSH